MNDVPELQDVEQKPVVIGLVDNSIWINDECDRVGASNTKRAQMHSYHGVLLMRGMRDHVAIRARLASMLLAADEDGTAGSSVPSLFGGA